MIKIKNLIFPQIQNGMYNRISDQFAPKQQPPTTNKNSKTSIKKFNCKYLLFHSYLDVSNNNPFPCVLRSKQIEAIYILSQHGINTTQSDHAIYLSDLVDVGDFCDMLP